MRVLYITHSNALDGANRSLLQLVKELRDNHGVDPVVVCPRDRNAHVLADAYAKEGIECIAIRLVSFKLAGHRSLFARLLLALSFIVHNVYLIYALRRVRFDLVHSNSSVIDMGVYLAMWRGVPHVWHLREFGYEDFRMEPVFGRGYERWVYRKCTCAIAISKAIGQKYKPYFGSRLRLVYNGVVPQPASLSATHANSVPVFCIVGRLEPNKNQMEVLKACRRLKREGKCAFRLLIVGGGGNTAYIEELKRYVAANRLEDEVEFMSYRNDVPKVLSKCDVGLTASTNEAFGRVTVEYMMQNLAVIASDTGANPEIIDDGTTGLLYHSGDAAQLADKMKLLAENRDLLLRLADNGRRQAQERFSSVSNSDSIYRLYTTLVKQ